MMRQNSFAEAGFEKFRKKTRREQFLEDMDKVVPWQELVEVIEPYYPKAGGRGRPPVGIERMLRIYFLQHWFNLSDPAVEEALYDSTAMRQFVGIDLGREPAPDETTVCKFRHRLEEHELTPKLFLAINHYLALKGPPNRLGVRTLFEQSLPEACISDQGVYVKAHTTNPINFPRS